MRSTSTSRLDFSTIQTVSTTAPATSLASRPFSPDKDLNSSVEFGLFSGAGHCSFTKSIMLVVNH